VFVPQQEPLIEDQRYETPIEENRKISFQNENPSFQMYLRNSLSWKCCGTYLAPIMVILITTGLFIAFLIVFAVKTAFIHTDSSQYTRQTCTIMSFPFNCDLDDDGNFCQYNITYIVANLNVTSTSSDKAQTIGFFYSLYEIVPCWIKRTDTSIVSFRDRDKEYSDDVLYVILIAFVLMILLILLAVTLLGVVLTFRKKYYNQEGTHPVEYDGKQSVDLGNAFQDDRM
jgi:hypothetical protein